MAGYVEYRGRRLYVKDTDSEAKIDGRRRRIDREIERSGKRRGKAQRRYRRQEADFLKGEEEEHGDFV